MEFDIVDMTTDEIKALSVVQMKMLRTAQQKKDALYHTAERELQAFTNIVMTNCMVDSTLIEAKKADLQKELDYQCAIIADNLVYNMSLNEPSSDGDIGGGGGDSGAGYIVDYSLSYIDRYAIVRDFYFAIEDKDERMALYTADATARQYLGAYYSTLYNVLDVYSK